MEKNKFDTCKHDKKIKDGAGITDGCHHRGVVLGMRFPDCWEPKKEKASK